MRVSLVHLIHQNESRLRLERAEDAGTATPEQLAKLKKLRSELITNLITEVTQMGRELANHQYRARRPFGA